MLDDDHSDRCEVIAHCGFGLYFSDDQWRWASFRMPAGHLCFSLRVCTIQAQLRASPWFGNFKHRCGLHWWLSGKESACTAGDLAWSLGWEDPLRRAWQPVPACWLENPRGQRSRQAAVPGVTESDPTKLSTAHTEVVLASFGSLVQYSSPFPAIVVLLISIFQFNKEDSGFITGFNLHVTCCGLLWV